MKKITLMKQLLLAALLVGMVLPVSAQDLYLPATTKSKEAKALYTEALDAFYDVEFARMNKINQNALEADPYFFMGYFIQSFAGDKEKQKAAWDMMATYDGKMNKGEKVIKQMAVKLETDPKYTGVEEARQLVKLYPKNIFAKIMLAYGLGGEDATRNEGINVLDEAIMLNPEVASLHNTKGYLYLEENELDKAKEAFDKYIEMAPDKANPYDSKGDYFMATKAYDEAAMSYQKAFDMNNDFAFSKTKHKEAMWMAKREMIASEVKQQVDKLVAGYNLRNMKKYLACYSPTPDFCFVANGEVIDSYKQFAKEVHKSYDMYSDWHVEVLTESIEVAAESIAVVTQVFMYKGVPKEGDEEAAKGSYTTVWRKNDGKWKVVQAIEVFPIKE